MSWYLSRARLRATASVATLRDLLLPSDANARVAASHKLVWALFGDAPDRKRDFLWRETGPGEYYLLSARVPTDPHGLFDLDPPKIWAPAIAPGDRLGFSLRANATVSRATTPHGRGKVEDVVMRALHPLARNARAEARAGVVADAGKAWMVRQGPRSGFAIGDADQVRVEAHRVIRLYRRGPAAVLGVLDLTGTLTVADPEVLVASVVAGFGRAKAFGNGLMLLRRI